MISGTQTWQQDLAAGQKQPIYAFEVPEFGIVLASTPEQITASTPIATVKKYYPAGADYYGDLKQSLAWLLACQAAAIGNWVANATPTYGAANQQLIESGIDFLAPSGFALLQQTTVENIILYQPAGVSIDNSAGPDGFPINYVPINGQLFLNVFQNTIAQKLSGGCFNLNPALSIAITTPVNAYRVDLYSRTDQFYYQGSAWVTVNPNGTAQWTVPYGGVWKASTGYPLYTQIIDTNNNVQRVTIAGTSGSSQPTWNATVGGATTDGNVTWTNMGQNLVAAGTVIAVLYAGGMPPPLGAAGATIPGGWVAHSNMGVGQKLANYFARIYVKTDVEYLQEDNVPIIVQDGKHARCGSSVVPYPGTPTLHVIYQDPVAGNVAVFTSLQAAEAYQNLVRSFTIPTSDPLFVSDVTKSSAPALQNRGMTYDQALGYHRLLRGGQLPGGAEDHQAVEFLPRQSRLPRHDGGGEFRRRLDGAVVEVR